MPNEWLDVADITTAAKVNAATGGDPARAGVRASSGHDQARVPRRPAHARHDVCRCPRRRAQPHRHRHGRRSGDRGRHGVDVLRALGLDVVVVSSAPADLPGDDPPAPVGAAMLEADVIFELTSVFIGSCPARREACERGARYLTVPGLDVDDAAPARAVRGRLPCDRRAGQAARGAPRRRGGVPPDEPRRHGSPRQLRGPARATALGDRGRSRAAMPPRRTSRSARARSRARPRGASSSTARSSSWGPTSCRALSSCASQAAASSIWPAPNAWRLADALERSGDERMWNLAEVSIGLNPCSRPGGSALELEGIVGGAHVAVGNNVAYGGSVDARSHIDCVLLRATLVARRGAARSGRPLTPGCRPTP